MVLITGDDGWVVDQLFLRANIKISEQLLISNKFQLFRIQKWRIMELLLPSEVSLGADRTLTTLTRDVEILTGTTCASGSAPAVKTETNT